jgi:Mrp family chromosome partitioning ATPase/capsular polysaccharide biosynthesis protein
LKAAMLNAPTRLSHTALGIRPEVTRISPARSASQLPLHELFIGTRRQIAIVLTATIAAFSLGLIYLLAVSPHYTAVAELLIDTQRSRSPLDAPNSSVDLSIIASQVETLKSETIARTVISKLGLDNDPEFVEPNLFSRMAAWIGDSARTNSLPGRQRTAIDRFGRALDVFLAGRSYAAVVRFTSVDPEKAARVTNAVCDAYIDDQLEAQTLNSTKANLWFERRLAELRGQADRANQALADFRKENPGQLDSLRQEQFQSLLAAVQVQNRAYDTFQNLSRYSRTVEQQAFPSTEARVVTRAEPPLTRSGPPIGLTLLFSAIAGCGLGMVVAYAREYLGRTVRTRQHVERDLNVRCLGFLPLLKPRRRWKWRRFGFGRSSGGPLNAHESPFGASEVLLGVRIALDACNASSTGTTIGITSPHLGEGKTTLAFNLAKCIADGGKRVLLIDADFRSLSLTKSLAPQSRRGLPEVLRGALPLSDIDVMPGLGFHLLPLPLDRIIRRPPDILSSRQMGEMLDCAKSTFDYVVLDLPPAIDHVDACASASQLDLFVLVAEWGRTKTTDLEAVWTRCDRIAERMVGVIVNKIPPGSEWR